MSTASTPQPKPLDQPGSGSYAKEKNNDQPGSGADSVRQIKQEK